jgi:ABC-type transport system substrate-binding protein
MGAAALALIGCSSDDKGSTGTDTEEAPAQTNAAPAQRGGRIGSVMSTVNNYNIVTNWQDGWRNAGIVAYDRLITSRADKRRYVLEAAESVELATPTRVVFKLRPDMVYHNIAPVNGRAVTADDIVTSQNYVRDLPNAENSSFQRSYMDRIEAPDPRTVVLTLKAPSAYLFSSLQLGNGTAQPIVPKELLSSMDQTPPIGSGPWQLAEHTFNTRYLWKRFDKWREAKEDKPYVDEREVFVLTDPVAQEAGFRSGQIDLWTPPIGSVDRLLGELDKAKVEVEQILSTSLFNWEMNTDPQFSGSMSVSVKPSIASPTRSRFSPSSSRARASFLLGRSRRGSSSTCSPRVRRKPTSRGIQGRPRSSWMLLPSRMTKRLSRSVRRRHQRMRRRRRSGSSNCRALASSCVPCPYRSPSGCQTESGLGSLA